MSSARDLEPASRQKAKPPRRHWKAAESFFDLKLAHFLTLALLAVGGSQAYIYLRQAGIMETQTDISKNQLALQESMSRGWIRADISLDGPIIFTEWANDKFINLKLKFDLKNFGSVPAVNMRTAAIIAPFGGGDRKARLDELQSSACKTARNLADGDKIGGAAAFPTESPIVRSGSGMGGLYKNGDPGALAVIGCIDYTYADNKHGQTGFRKVLGRVENKLVAGIPFVSGEPRASQEPISPELLAAGYPKDPARVAEVSADGLYFEDEEDGNYAK